MTIEELNEKIYELRLEFDKNIKSLKMEHAKANNPVKSTLKL